MDETMRLTLQQSERLRFYSVRLNVCDGSSLVFGLSANFDFFCQSPTRMTVILSFSFLRCIYVLTYDLL